MSNKILSIILILLSFNARAQKVALANGQKLSAVLLKENNQYELKENVPSLKFDKTKYQSAYLIHENCYNTILTKETILNENIIEPIKFSKHFNDSLYPLSIGKIRYSSELASELETSRENVDESYIEAIRKGLSDEGIIPDLQNTNIFSDSKNVPGTNFLIGAEIYSFHQDAIPDIKTKSFTLWGVLKIRWQILNRTSGLIVLEDTTEYASTMTGLTNSLIPFFKVMFYGCSRTFGLSQDLNLFLKQINSGTKNQNSLTHDSIVLKRLIGPTFNSNVEMLKKCKESVVTIKTNLGHGSGFVISADGYILTNYHVIEGAENIETIFPVGLKLIAKVVKVDITADLAILKVNANGLDFLTLSDVNKGETGETIYVIGTPKDIALEQTVTKGVISAMRQFDGVNYIQIDASINPGNSGGPILNEKGNVIGIVTLKRIEAEGISLGISVKNILEKLLIQYK